MRTLLIKRLDSSFYAFKQSLRRFRDATNNRQFRQQHPEQFRRIKGLPLRARVGRADPARAGGTVTFIRSQRRDAFYRIPGDSRGEEAPPDNPALPTPHSAPEEITLLEAAAEFRAPDPSEKGIPLHAAHHDHINTWPWKDSRKPRPLNALQNQTVDATQGPNEVRSLALPGRFFQPAIHQ